MLTRPLGISRSRPPVALQDEAGPVVRLAPAWIAGQLALRGAERGGRCKLLLEHSAVEASHELGGRMIADLPEAGDDARHAGVHERACETDQAFALTSLPSAV